MSYGKDQTPRLVGQLHEAAPVGKGAIIVSEENLQTVARSLALVIGGATAPKFDPKEESYRDAAKNPAIVCIKKPGHDGRMCAWIGFVGPEPKDERAWKAEKSWLGHGGNGYALVDAFGEATITHNLNSDEFVDPKYAVLFEATHVSCHLLTDAEERAIWAGYNPFEGAA